MSIRELLGNIKELLLKLLCIIMILWLFFKEILSFSDVCWNVYGYDDRMSGIF